MDADLNLIDARQAGEAAAEFYEARRLDIPGETYLGPIKVERASYRLE